MDEVRPPRPFGLRLNWSRVLLLFAFQVLAVSHQAIDVKYDHDRILVLEPNSAKPVLQLRVLDRTGREVVVIEPAVAGARRIEFRDAAVTAAGAVAISITYSGQLGRDSSAIAVYDSGPPRIIDLTPYICTRLEAAPDGGFRCLGYDLSRRVRRQDYPLFAEFDANGIVRRTLLPRSIFPAVDNLADVAREPFSQSSIGRPQLLGGLFAWLPNAATVFRLEQPEARWPVPLPRAGRSIITMAAASDGRLFALFPLGDEETFTTPYTLFELVPESGKWLRVPAIPLLPRSAQLIGAGSDFAVVWNRSVRAVEWYPLPPVSRR